jgi:hypothetical protein
LKEELLNSTTAFYWLLLLLRAEMTSTRQLSPELERALEKARNENRRAINLYERWRILGKVPEDLRDARPGRGSHPSIAPQEETGSDTEEGLA